MNCCSPVIFCPSISVSQCRPKRPYLWAAAPVSRCDCCRWSEASTSPALHLTGCSPIASARGEGPGPPVRRRAMVPAANEDSAPGRQPPRLPHRPVALLRRPLPLSAARSSTKKEFTADSLREPCPLAAACTVTAAATRGGEGKLPLFGTRAGDIPRICACKFCRVHVLYVLYVLCCGVPKSARIDVMLQGCCRKEKPNWAD